MAKHELHISQEPEGLPDGEFAGYGNVPDQYDTGPASKAWTQAVEEERRVQESRNNNGSEHV